MKEEFILGEKVFVSNNLGDLNIQVATVKSIDKTWLRVTIDGEASCPKCTTQAARSISALARKKINHIDIQLSGEKAYIHGLEGDIKDSKEHISDLESYKALWKALLIPRKDKEIK